jgi:hypothetical protein
VRLWVQSLALLKNKKDPNYLCKERDVQEDDIQDKEQEPEKGRVGGY